MNQILESYSQIQNQIYGCNILREEQHLVPKIEEYYNIILSQTYHQLKDGENHLIITEDSFQEFDNFFNHIAINIDAFIDNTSNRVSQNSTTNTNQRPLINGKIDNLIINIAIKGPKNNFPYILASAFYHEFHHAYEDWKRKLLTKNHEGLSLYFALSNYHNINFIKSNCGVYGQALGEILYHLAKMEQRSYIQGAIGEFKQLIKIKPSVAQIPLKDVVNSLPSVAKYIQLYKHYDVLNNLSNNDIQNQVLGLFNINSGLAKHLNPNEVNLFNSFNTDFTKYLKKYKIKSYKGLMTFLKHKIDTAYENIIYNISKILGEYCVNEMFVSRNIIETTVI